jgi:hypothetical protein
LFKYLYYWKWCTVSKKNPHPNISDSLHRTRKIILKFTWKYKRPWRVKVILSKKNYAKAITIADFKIQYRVILTKSAWYSHRKQTHRPMESNWIHRNKHTHTHTHTPRASWLSTKISETYAGEKIARGGRKTGYLYEEC